MRRLFLAAVGRDKIDGIIFLHDFQIQKFEIS